MKLIKHLTGNGSTYFLEKTELIKDLTDLGYGWWFYRLAHPSENLTGTMSKAGAEKRPHQILQ